MTRTVLCRVSPMVSESRCLRERTYFGNFTQGPAFFTEVDDDAGAPFLGFFDSLLDAEDQIWAACADIGAEDITSITLKTC